MTADDEMSAGERAIDEMLGKSHFAAQYQVPGLVAEHAATIGVGRFAIYLADLQQSVLVPFTGSVPDAPVETLAIDGTLAGRSFQLMTVLTQNLDDGYARVWLPMIDGTERLGVLSADIPAADVDQIESGLLGTRLRRYCSLVAELVMTRTNYGDTIVRLRRRRRMDLAAELQWSLLPPLTFSTEVVTITGALEPAYEVAGDIFDYAVDEDVVRGVVLDSMGHGLASSQFATIAIAAYRNLRRAGADLVSTTEGMQRTLAETFRGEHFATAVVAELETDTGRFRWVNAGHPPPMLLRGRRLVHELECSPAPPLGIPPALRGHALEESSVQLEPGDRVLLYTDGVLEARSPDGEFFGEQRLVDLLRRHFAAELPAPETLRRVVRALLDHQGGVLDDDATMLLFEWRTDVSALRF